MDKRKRTTQPPDTTMGHIVSDSNEPLPEVDLHSEELLQDYVIENPVPLSRKLASDDADRAFWRKHWKKILTIVLAVVVVVLLAIGLWMFWRGRSVDQPVEDQNVVDQPTVLDHPVDLKFDDKKVVDTYQYVERVVYAEPFLNFYPMKELTRGDLSSEQLMILRDEEPLPVTMDGVEYIHHLYAAEEDDNKINLYEAVVIAEPTTCEMPEENECMAYRTLNGTSLDDVYDTNHWWVHNDKMDHFRWTFLENTEGTYTLQSITSVEHLAGNGS